MTDVSQIKRRALELAREGVHEVLAGGRRKSGQPSVGVRRLMAPCAGFAPNISPSVYRSRPKSSQHNG